VLTQRNIKKAKITIKENKLKGFQYFHTMNSSTSSTILDKLGVIFFPTYILLDHTGKVLQFTNDLNRLPFKRFYENYKIIFYLKNNNEYQFEN
jgi:hypothetical protein